MAFDVTATKAVYVELYHALYGTDRGAAWKLQYSTDQGASWHDATPIGADEPIVTPTAALTPIAYQIEPLDGPVRIRVVKTDGSTDTAPRINIDDIALYTKATLAAPPADGSDAKDTSALHIIHTNDIHGNIHDFAKLAKVVEKTRDEHAFTLFIDVGDQFGGDPVTDLAKGKPMVELFNAMNLDAMVVGNHDFDYGPDIFQARRDEATSPWLAANVAVEDPTKTPITQPDPYVIIQIDRAGHRTLYKPGAPFERTPDVLTIGLLAITQNPPATAPKNVVGLRFDDYASTIEKYLFLRDQVDVFILTTHIGYPDDRVLAEAFPQIDLIVGAHSHTTLTRPVFVHGVPIVQTGAHMDNVGHTWLELARDENGHYTVARDAEGKRRVMGELLPTRSLTEADPDIQAIVDRYAQAVEGALSVVIGKTEKGLSQSGKNTGDVALGNFWTDAMRAYVREVAHVDLAPTIAFMNAGGIRGDIPAGEITRRQIFEIEPFSNFISVIRMRGKDILEILKYSYTRDGRNSIDLQVSGMNYTIVTDALGNFKAVRATVNGEPLDENAVYDVLVPDYIGSGGSGYPFPALGETLYTAVWLVRDALEWYAGKLTQERGSVEATREGRITVERDAADQPDVPLISIAEARKVQEGAVVRVRGTVTTVPGSWGAKGFYLQDETSGLYVYTPTDYGLAPGHAVEVIGKTKEYNGEWEIDSPLEVRTLETGAPLPNPKTIRPADLPEVQGELVRLPGVTISGLKEVNKYGTFEFTATTEDGAAALIRVDSRTGLAYKDFPFKNGDRVDVVGIASVYDAVYQIKPRGAADIVAAREKDPGEAPRVWSLRILHTNDTHSHLEHAARLATLIKQARAEAEAAGVPALLLDAGDVFTGTLYFTRFEGLSDAEVMNRIGYQAMTLGNHEFDKGPKGLAKFLKALNFPVLAANLEASREPQLRDLVSTDVAEGAEIQPGHVYPAIVLEVGGKRIGLFGLVTEETKAISSPGENVTFTDAIETATRMVRILKDKRVDLIIALTHIGFDEDVKLAQAVPGIDVIVGGHSHTKLDRPSIVTGADGAQTVIVQASEHRKYLGQLDLERTADGRFARIEGTLIPTSQKDENNQELIAADPEIQALIDGYDAEIKALKEQIVGETEVNLNGERVDVRTRETNLGDLIADGMVAFARRFVPETQAAITNGGGIRASIPS
ncbi:5'-nucleotidase C-terminal domain-containing protein [Hydrogenibacillus sp. N12]|uniref:5'-nucleotidase C-terminal domain-containing protein n=1 Tax=Hydrogenibacillus sp. N12 TaxID=2866627 RepID=UPI001C7DB18F|nr:5'-nucleotidase C-terminal domain-containing protein [Hydrogenibacillus sp. N12]QZA33572.1 5'-nucleotidase C-terminal domain-containing protein [Hydrogenibacillus sp. N12]